MRGVYSFFDKLEDKIRGFLSHYPIIYALIGGVGVVLFWRGVWHLADELPFMTSIVSIASGSILLLATGLLVSVFIGDQVIISGLRGEKKVTEKTEVEVEYEIGRLEMLEREVRQLSREIARHHGESEVPRPEGVRTPVKRVRKI